MKWYISLHDIAVLNDSGPETLKESNPPNIVALKSQASTVRDQLRRMETVADSKGVSWLKFSIPILQSITIISFCKFITISQSYVGIFKLQVLIHLLRMYARNISNS